MNAQTEPPANLKPPHGESREKVPATQRRGAGPIWRFSKALVQSMIDDHVLTGSAALSYYLLFSLFPGLIFLLTLLPYLPVANLHQTVMGFLTQALPLDAARAVESVVAEVTLHKRGGLLSFGIILTVWSASSAISAIMEEVNVTFAIVDTRSYLRGKLIAIGLAIYLAVTFILSGIFLVGGAWMQNWLNTSGAIQLGLSENYHEHWQLGLEICSLLFKWAVLAFLVLSAFAVTFFVSLDRTQLKTKVKFSLFTPGALVGVALFFAASVAFRAYVADISNYTASYGSLGAVIILLIWLYIAGLILLLASEINALLWSKTEKWLPEQAHSRE